MIPIYQTSPRLLALMSLLTCSSGYALDSGNQTLQAQVGASDYFKASCASNKGIPTDHLSFSLLDDSLSSPSTDIPPQKLNVHIVKDGIELKSLTTEAGNSTETLINSGNGRYKIGLDTLGTNTFLESPQSYSIEYQCFNSARQNTKASGFKSGSSKSLKNGARASLTLNCASNKNATPIETSALFIKITNTSSLAVEDWLAALPILNAQITKDDAALNVSDRAGDIQYSKEVKLIGNNGDYLISVNNTGTDSRTELSKRYAFSYQCQDINNQETSTSTLEVIQDE